MPENHVQYGSVGSINLPDTIMTDYFMLHTTTTLRGFCIELDISEVAKFAYE